MGYMQRRRLTVDSDLDAQATWRYKLPAVGKFTAFEVVVEAQRLADRAANTSPISVEQECTKVELLRGGTRPIISLTGSQVDALNYWDFRVPTVRKYRQLAAQWNDHHFFLMGGRSLYDREYGFDMQRLGETYFELTHDMTADVTEGFDASTAKVTIYAYQWMGADAPLFTAYFRSRQLAYWTTSAANIIKTIEIPVGNPVRRIGVQAGTRAATIGGTVKEIEVVVNDGEYSPVHIKSCMNWVQAEVAEYGLENELSGIDFPPQIAIVDLPLWFSYYQSGFCRGYADYLDSLKIQGLVTAPMKVYHAHATGHEMIFGMRGWGFQKCLRIGFDHEEDGFDLLQTRGLGALDLVCTENAADKAARVFVQDVISY